MKYCCSCSEAFQSSDWKCPHCLWSPPFAGGFPAFALPLSVANEGFADHYFSDLVSLETGHFWFESRNRLLASTLRNHFPAFQTFLEIGCGTGFVLSGLQKQFRHVRFSGSEIFSSGLAFAHDRLPSVQLFQMDARHIPFRDEYDVIGHEQRLRCDHQPEITIHYLTTPALTNNRNCACRRIRACAVSTDRQQAPGYNARIKRLRPPAG